MRTVHHLRFILGFLCAAALLVSVGQADTFRLNNGTTLTGELVESGSNDANALIRVGEGQFERVPWGQFSQEDLKRLQEKYGRNKRILEAVEPFIEVSAEERAQKTEVTIKPPEPAVEALQRERAEPKRGFFPSFFQSGVGWFVVLVLLAANVFAGYEIAIFRAQPVPLVTGLAAIPLLGFISNLVFLALPTRVEKKSEEDLAYEEQLAAEPQKFAVPGAPEAAAEAAATAEVRAAQAVSGPPPETFTRGQTTFNKRFFETKFVSFFGIARREEDRRKTLHFKTSRGAFVATRISRITASDIHILVDKGGGATQEVGLQFVEIQEVTLHHQ